MKCKFCGAILSIEDEYCPHCGMVNEEARKHVEDMKHYEKEFEETKENVYKATTQYTKRTTKVIVIAIMLVINIALFWASDNAYGLQSDFLRWKAVQSADKHREVLDTYLEEEKFIEFYEYTYTNRISTWELEFETYHQLDVLCNNYASIYENLLNLLCYEETWYQDKNYYIEALSNELEYFYGNLDMEKYMYNEEYDREINKKAIEAIEKKVDNLLFVYAGLTKEEINELMKLNGARRELILEEVFGNE